MDLPEINDYAQGINHIRLGTLNIWKVNTFTPIHVELLQHKIYIPRLRQIEHPLPSITIDAKYI